MNRSIITLQAKDLFKSFVSANETIAILKGASLAVKQGETIAIIGPSGVGKSTLLHILGTLDTPSSGELYIHDQLVDFKKAATLRNQHIGFVFQAFHLLEDSTALENVLLPAAIARKPIHKTSPSYIRANALLEALGLSQRSHYLTKVLSGGEKQRVALARALLNDPSLILADEPTGNLDEKHAIDIHHLLIDFAKKLNKSLIVVTHHPHLHSLCDSTYVLTDGILVKQ